MVQAIVVPADISEPIRLQQLDDHDAGAYRRIVGGSFDAVDLFDPRASMYFIDDSDDVLLMNHRLSMLLWMHNSRYRGMHAFAGDGLIVGPPDHEGNDQDAPAELIELLFKTEQFVVEAKRPGVPGWYSSQNPLSTWVDAYRLALKLALEWSLAITDVRVVPGLPSELRETWYRIGTKTPPLHDAVDPAFTKNGFIGCHKLEELEERLGDGYWVLGTSIYYRDLCFICMEEAADDWLVIRHGVAIGRMALKPRIKAGEFGELIARLLAATKEQCLRLEY